MQRKELKMLLFHGFAECKIILFDEVGHNGPGEVEPCNFWDVIQKVLELFVQGKWNLI